MVCLRMHLVVTTGITLGNKEASIYVTSDAKFRLLYLTQDVKFVVFSKIILIFFCRMNANSSFIRLCWSPDLKIICPELEEREYVTATNMSKYATTVTPLNASWHKIKISKYCASIKNGFDKSWVTICSFNMFVGINRNSYQMSCSTKCPVCLQDNLPFMSIGVFADLEYGWSWNWDFLARRLGYGIQTKKYYTLSGHIIELSTVRIRYLPNISLLRTQ